MNLEAYLDRIGYAGRTDRSAATLSALHRAHLFSIPFENLDIHVPTPIVLTEEALFQKLVLRRRGGFCFEQNGLFAAVLRELGFDVDMLEANVFSHDRGVFGVPMGHMALAVTVDGVRYLADVGFGASFIDPIRLDTPEVQTHDAGDFRIELGSLRPAPAPADEPETPSEMFYCRELGAPEMHIAYRFSLRPRRLGEYEEACHYMQTSPLVPFTQKRPCSQWTPAGRVTLTEGKLIRTNWDGVREEQSVPTEAEFHRLLLEVFGIGLQTRKPAVA